jgi:hypothetical protein
VVLEVLEESYSSDMLLSNSFEMKVGVVLTSVEKFWRGASLIIKLPLPTYLSLKSYFYIYSRSSYTAQFQGGNWHHPLSS